MLVEYNLLAHTFSQKIKDLLFLFCGIRHNEGKTSFWVLAIRWLFATCDVKWKPCGAPGRVQGWSCDQRMSRRLM